MKLWKKYNYTKGEVRIYALRPIIKYLIIVTFLCTQIQDTVGDPNEEFLFHGSPFVNNIVQSGFDERHACSTGMFGAGECQTSHNTHTHTLCRYILMSL